MAVGDLKIGVLSRRAPISQNADLSTALEHVGGLTRVLPALAEFAEIAWTSLTTSSQIGLPKQYSFSKISGQDFQYDIGIFLSEVNGYELNQSDWLCAHYMWPLLHDMPIPEESALDVDAHFEAIRTICQAMAANSVDTKNDGYLVNDFQLSQIPIALKKLEPQKLISFFLHTPWPKLEPRSDFTIKILKFLATGMLGADVIEFQTQKDLQAFEKFAVAHLPIETIRTSLKVNPVSVNVQELQQLSRTQISSLNLEIDDISYVHIARSDPIKNTLVTIKSFSEMAIGFQNSQHRNFLDLFVVPSRQQWPEYQELLAEIVNCVEICNSRLSFLDYLPIRLHIGNDYRQASQALIRYDYLIACSVADGLNLVVKEGAILNTRNGVIVSAAKVGAMSELGKYCVIAEEANVESLAKALLTAENLDSKSREVMSTSLKAQIKEFDASHWAKSVVANFKVLETV